jgi:DNA-binding NarL/FixJ family response regulator
MPLRCLVLADSGLSAKGVYGFLDSSKVEIVNLDDYDRQIADCKALKDLNLAILAFNDHDRIIHSIELIKKTHHELKILVLSSSKAVENLIDIIKYCADYLLLDKEIDLPNINKIIDTIYHSKYIEILRIPSSLILPNLSKREVDVVDSLQRGYSTEEICTRLGFTRDTLQKHIKHCAIKLDTDNSRAAVVVASLRGLGDFSDFHYRQNFGLN